MCLIAPFASCMNFICCQPLRFNWSLQMARSSAFIPIQCPGFLGGNWWKWTAFYDSEKIKLFLSRFCPTFSDSRPVYHCTFAYANMRDIISGFFLCQMCAVENGNRLNAPQTQFQSVFRHNSCTILAQFWATFVLILSQLFHTFSPAYILMRGAIIFCGYDAAPGNFHRYFV